MVFSFTIALVGLLVGALTLAVMPLVPEVTASSSQPADQVQQQQAAERLMAQLDAQGGQIDPADLVFDPALGPPPWTSYMPGRDQSTIDAWIALSQRVGAPKPDPNAAERLIVGTFDNELPGQTGLNDTIETGQPVPGFGSNADDTATISGTLSTPPPPPPPLFCPSSELDNPEADDGSVFIANITGIAEGEIQLCGGLIGDGPWTGPDDGGDIDVFEIGFIPGGSVIIADAFGNPEGVSIAIYQESLEGTFDLLAETDDFGPEFLDPVAPDDGFYYGVIAGLGSLPSDVTNPNSGQGNTTLGSYDFFLGSFLPPPPPPGFCQSSEIENGGADDGSIANANLVPDFFSFCSGFIGDGPFAETSGDFDMFELDIPAEFFEPAGVQIVADAFPTAPPGEPELGVRLALYDINGNLIAEVDDPANEGDIFLDETVIEPGRYFLSVSAPGHVGDPNDSEAGQGDLRQTPYNVVVIFGNAVPPPPDPEQCGSREPDDDAANANPAANGLVGTSCIGAFGDSTPGFLDFDFYVLQADAPSNELIIDVGVNVDIVSTQVFDAFGNEIVTEPDEPLGELAAVERAEVGPGTYYVVVGETGTQVAPSVEGGPLLPDPQPGENSVAIYRVEMVILPFFEDPEPLLAAKLADHAAAVTAWQAQVDAQVDQVIQNRNFCEAITEDNGSISTAVPVEVPGDTCFSFLGDGEFGNTSGDFDLYGVDLVGGDYLSVQVTSLDGDLDGTLTLYDSDGQVVAFNDDSDGLNPALGVDLLVGGRYYIAVGAFSSTQLDPFDSGSGNGAASTGDYEIDIFITDEGPNGGDVDVYLVELLAGDVIRAGFEFTGALTIVDPSSVIRQRSTGSASFIYPLTSPLRHLGGVGVDHVADVDGTYAIVLSDGAGPYTGELKVVRPGRSNEPGTDQQIVFLDFDGALLDPAIYDPFVGAIGERPMSPLSSFLPNWGLDASDEDNVIDEILAVFEETVSTDLRLIGGNGDRDSSGIPGEVDIEILNSRDHDDPWGEPNVTRIIIGGTIDELGIGTIGIAQSIDPGNLDPEETGIVLLDILSQPGGFLNVIGLAPGSTIEDLIGQAVGGIAAHELGHMLGDWHTETFNANFGIMDQGGDIANTIIGIGPDQIFGSADDTESNFHEDQFAFNEGFGGREDTRIRSGFALATGQTPPDPDEPELVPGTYFLRNVGTGRWLDADSGNRADTSSSPQDDDRWELQVAPDGNWYLRNLTYNDWLDTDGSSGVDLSDSPSTDDIWSIAITDDGTWILTAVQRGGNLTVVNNDVTRTSRTDADAQWEFEPLDDPPPPGDSLAPGNRVALQNVATGRYLDADSDNVEQSTSLQDDDIWVVVDAGNGRLAFFNEVYGRYLDADGSSQDYNVETSSSIADDDRWIVDELGDNQIQLQNFQLNRWLWADDGGDYNVETSNQESPQTAWDVIQIAQIQG